MAPSGPSLLEVGRISRPHGLRGEVVVALTTDRTERLTPGTALSTDKGVLVVRASRPHQDRWIVAFEGHGTREQADGKAPHAETELPERLRRPP